MNFKNIRAILRRLSPDVAISSLRLFWNIHIPSSECVEILDYLIAQDIIEIADRPVSDGLSPLKGYRLKISARQLEKLLLL